MPLVETACLLPTDGAPVRDTRVRCDEDVDPPPLRGRADPHPRIDSKDQAGSPVRLATGRMERQRGRIVTLAEERPRLERRRQNVTVDVELDQILTAFELTFLNLWSTLLTRYLGGHPLQLDTLIRRILTPPRRA